MTSYEVSVWSETDWRALEIFELPTRAMAYASYLRLVHGVATKIRVVREKVQDD